MVSLAKNGMLSARGSDHPQEAKPISRNTSKTKYPLVNQNKSAKPHWHAKTQIISKYAVKVTSSPKRPGGVHLVQWANIRLKWA